MNFLKNFWVVIENASQRFLKILLRFEAKPWNVLHETLEGIGGKRWDTQNRKILRLCVEFVEAAGRFSCKIRNFSGKMRPFFR